MIERIPKELKKINKPSTAAKIGYLLLADAADGDEHKEHMWVIGMNGSQRVLYVELCTLGIHDVSIIEPREAYRMAIIKNAASIMLMHNHPSGTMRPSDDDLKITERLRQSGEILGIKLLDHIIVGEKGQDRIETDGPSFYSFSEHNLI